MVSGATATLHLPCHLPYKTTQPCTSIEAIQSSSDPQTSTFSKGQCKGHHLHGDITDSIQATIYIKPWNNWIPRSEAFLSCPCNMLEIRSPRLSSLKMHAQLFSHVWSLCDSHGAGSLSGGLSTNNGVGCHFPPRESCVIKVGHLSCVSCQWREILAAGVATEIPINVFINILEIKMACLWWIDEFLTSGVILQLESDTRRPCGIWRDTVGKCTEIHCRL